MQEDYPDISNILAAKARRRRVLAALSWEEKVAIIERMRKSMPEGSWQDTPADENHEMPPQAGHPHR